MTNKRWRIWFLPVLILAPTAACASGAVSGSGGNRATGGDFLSTVSWDAEYDVVVIGFGGAGGTAAITAADAGARVLLLEKAPYGEEGGNTKYSGQMMLSPNNREKAITYMKQLRGDFGNQTDEIINFVVDGLMQNEEWLVSLGASVNIYYRALSWFQNLVSFETASSIWSN
jgi:hypothetical protein